MGKKFDKWYHMTMNNTKQEERKIKSYVVLHVLSYLVEHAEYNTNRICLTKANRLDLCKELDISDKQMRNALLDLINRDLLGEVLGNYYLNPKYYWKGKMSYRQKVIDQLSEAHLDGEDINFAKLLANPR
jgi:hypothetical protein